MGSRNGPKRVSISWSLWKTWLTSFNLPTEPFNVIKMRPLHTSLNIRVVCWPPRTPIEISHMGFRIHHCSAIQTLQGWKRYFRFFFLSNKQNTRYKIYWESGCLWCHNEKIEKNAGTVSALEHFCQYSGSPKMNPWSSNETWSIVSYD